MTTLIKDSLAWTGPDDRTRSLMDEPDDCGARSQPSIAQLHAHHSLTLFALLTPRARSGPAFVVALTPDRRAWAMQEVTASPMSAGYAPRSRTHPPPPARSPEPVLDPEPSIRWGTLL